MRRPPPILPLFPYPTLFRSDFVRNHQSQEHRRQEDQRGADISSDRRVIVLRRSVRVLELFLALPAISLCHLTPSPSDRMPAIVPDAPLTTILSPGTYACRSDSEVVTSLKKAPPSALPSSS